MNRVNILSDMQENLYGSMGFSDYRTSPCNVTLSKVESAFGEGAMGSTREDLYSRVRRMVCVNVIVTVNQHIQRTSRP